MIKPMQQKTNDIIFATLMALILISSFFSYEYGKQRQPDYIKLIEPISDNTYSSNYDCKNFTADSVNLLKENGYEAEPICVALNKTNNHAIVKLTLYIEPQNITIMRNITPGKCNRQMMEMVQ
jgi:hypothetical protein